MQYPLVEALTGLSFVLVYHLLAVEGAEGQLVSPLEWPRDLPILAAWLTLVAGMIACSGMDLLSYTVDIGDYQFRRAGRIIAYAAWPNARR